jgi:hypothetical protein
LLLLAGDALMAPFWPEGLGINRGFHSALDTAWCASRYTQIELLGGQAAKAPQQKQQLTDLLLARDGAYGLMRGVSGATPLFSLTSTVCCPFVLQPCAPTHALHVRVISFRFPRFQPRWSQS